MISFIFTIDIFYWPIRQSISDGYRHVYYFLPSTIFSTCVFSSSLTASFRFHKHTHNFAPTTKIINRHFFAFDQLISVCRFQSIDYTSDIFFRLPFAPCQFLFLFFILIGFFLSLPVECLIKSVSFFLYSLTIFFSVLDYVVKEEKGSWAV